VTGFSYLRSSSPGCSGSTRAAVGCCETTLKFIHPTEYVQTDEVLQPQQRVSEMGVRVRVRVRVQGQP